LNKEAKKPWLSDFLMPPCSGEEGLGGEFKV